VICAFIASVAEVFGVVPVCRALSGHGVAISPRTYHARRSRPPSRRAVRDAWLTSLLAGMFEPGQDGRRRPESLYGAAKAWGHLRRQGITVARCTVERLMRANGWRGNLRGRRKVRTTVPDPGHARHPDLVNRDFRAHRPGQLLVADFTYVPLAGGGFGYVAFVIDAFAGTIAGWECSLSKATAFVQRAIAQAAQHLRRCAGGPVPGGAIHHSDAGSQYTSLRCAESLMLAGLTPSVGTVGDAYDKTWASYCTSWRCWGENSAGELAALAFDQPRVAGVGRVEQRDVLVVGPVGGEQSGSAPVLDGGDVDTELACDLGEGEQAAAAEPFGMAGQLVAAA
jgi:putative transposase